MGREIQCASWKRSGGGWSRTGGRRRRRWSGGRRLQLQARLRWPGRGTTDQGRNDSGDETRLLGGVQAAASAAAAALWKAGTALVRSGGTAAATASAATATVAEAPPASGQAAADTTIAHLPLSQYRLTRRMVLITGFETFNLRLYREAAREARARVPELEVLVYTERDLDVESGRQEVEDALRDAEVVLCSLLFDFDVVEWLRPGHVHPGRRQQQQQQQIQRHATSRALAAVQDGTGRPRRGQNGRLPLVPQDRPAPPQVHPAGEGAGSAAVAGSLCAVERRRSGQRGFAVHVRGAPLYEDPADRRRARRGRAAGHRLGASGAAAEPSGTAVASQVRRVVSAAASAHAPGAARRHAALPQARHLRTTVHRRTDRPAGTRGRTAYPGVHQRRGGAHCGARPVYHRRRATAAPCRPPHHPAAREGRRRRGRDRQHDRVPAGGRPGRHHERRPARGRGAAVALHQERPVHGGRPADRAGQRFVEAERGDRPAIDRALRVAGAGRRHRHRGAGRAGRRSDSAGAGAGGSAGGAHPPLDGAAAQAQRRQAHRHRVVRLSAGTGVVAAAGYFGTGAEKLGRFAHPIWHQNAGQAPVSGRRAARQGVGGGAAAARSARRPDAPAVRARRHPAPAVHRVLPVVAPPFRRRAAFRHARHRRVAARPAAGQRRAVVFGPAAARPAQHLHLRAEQPE
eukprot:ctg_2789.g604